MPPCRIVQPHDPLAGAAIAAGIERIRAELDVPGPFPPEVLAAADEAARRDPSATHVDRTDVAFRTLDPASSTDLDQAFDITTDGDDVVLAYAIADVGHFVEPGGVIDQEAWRRGTTIYLPGARSPLYPEVLSQGAASLLPDGPRPAVVFTVVVAGDGTVTLRAVERAIIRSRAKLAYDTVTAADLPPAFAELARRIVAAEDARGAPRVVFPEQELEYCNGQWELRFARRLASEDQNAGMSLATNLAVAGLLATMHTGIFRVMDAAGHDAESRLRRTARGLGLHWPRNQTLAAFERSLRPDEPRGAAFLLAVRRAGGRATYAPYVEGVVPWHAAMAATYTHATAPLRRLVDRYVVDAALALGNGDALPGYVADAFERLPQVMDRADGLAGRVDAAVRDMAEAVLLAGRVGETFDAIIVDDGERGTVVQIAEPAVLAKVSAANVDPGDTVRVKVLAADPVARRVDLQRVG